MYFQLSQIVCIAVKSVSFINYQNIRRCKTQIWQKYQNSSFQIIHCNLIKYLYYYLNKKNQEMPNLYDSAQLRKILDREQFAAARRGETQKQFQNKYWNNFRPGIYSCVVCQTPLFSSKHKYQDGFGWPAFYDQLSRAATKKLPDHQLDYQRQQVKCRRCDSHIGFMFKDGPKNKTGIRYSVNSASLVFEQQNNRRN